MQSDDTLIPRLQWHYNTVHCSSPHCIRFIGSRSCTLLRRLSIRVRPSLISSVEGNAEDHSYADGAASRISTVPGIEKNYNFKETKYPEYFYIAHLDISFPGRQA